MKTDKNGYRWDWCGTCDGAYVECPKCGNNSCNGGSGAFDKDGNHTMWGCSDAITICDQCAPTAKYYHDNDAPKFNRSEKLRSRKYDKRFKRSIFG